MNNNTTTVMTRIITRICNIISPITAVLEQINFEYSSDKFYKLEEEEDLLNDIDLGK